MKNTKIVAVTMLVIALFFGAYYFSSILMLFGIAGILAFLLNPIVKLLVKKCNAKKGFAIFFVLIILALLIGIVVSTIVPMIGGQITSFAENMPTYSKTLNNYYQAIVEELVRLDIPESYLQSMNSVLSSFESYVSSLLVKALSVTVSKTMQILDVIIVITLTVYFMKDSTYFVDKIASLLPTKAGKRFRDITKESYDMIWKYLKSKTIISFGMAITTYIVLKIIGVEFALLLAVLAFFLDYIPYFGSIIAGCVAAITTLITGTLPQVVAVAISILVIQQIEGNVVIPKVQGDSVGLHPIAVMFAILACNQLWGPLGMFMAVPIGGLIKILARELHQYLMSE